MRNGVDAENVGILGLMEPSRARCTRALSIPERDVTAALTFPSKSRGQGHNQHHPTTFRLVSTGNFHIQRP